MNWLRKGQRLGKQFEYICDACAKKDGAVWPKGHVATYHMGECDGCTGMKNICAVSDWDWPEQRNLERGREI